MHSNIKVFDVSANCFVPVESLDGLNPFLTNVHAYIEMMPEDIKHVLYIAGLSCSSLELHTAIKLLIDQNHLINNRLKVFEHFMENEGHLLQVLDFKNLDELYIAMEG